jgi:hypothetical protein
MGLSPSFIVVVMVMVMVMVMVITYEPAVQVGSIVMDCWSGQLCFAVVLRYC